MKVTPIFYKWKFYSDSRFKKGDSLVLETGTDIDRDPDEDPYSPYRLFTCRTTHPEFLAAYPVIICILCVHDMTRRLI